MNKVRELRKSLKMTQEEFAKRINMSRANLGSIETGRIKLTHRTALDICREFSVNMAWLLNGTGDMYSNINIDINNLIDDLTNKDSNDINFKKKQDFLKAVVDLSKLSREDLNCVKTVCKSLYDSKFTINNRIKQIRLLEGLSQENFSNKIGVSRSVIANIEYNKVEVKEYIINLIVTTFNINKSWLITGVGEIKKEKDKLDEINEIIEIFNKMDVDLKQLIFDLKKLTPKQTTLINSLIKEFTNQ